MDALPEPVDGPPEAAAVVVVIAAHGSRLEEANEAHRGLVRTVAARSGMTAVPAFLELAEPSIAEALDGAALGGARRVLLLPFFLHPGNHVAVDLSSLAAAAAARHPEASIELLDPFGADPAVGGVLAGQVAAAVTGGERPDGG